VQASAVMVHCRSIMLVAGIDGYDVELAMTNSSLCQKRIGKGPNGWGRSLQHGGFKTVNVVEMHMHGRGHQVVVRMLRVS